MNPFYTVSFHFSKVTWMNVAHEYDVIVMQLIKDKEMILEFFKKVRRQSWKLQIMTEITISIQKKTKNKIDKKAKIISTL